MDTNERIVVGSTSVARIKYFPEKSILEVEFLPGTVYHYFNVSKEVADKALTGDEPGKFIAHEIKGKYQYEKVAR